MKNKISLSVVTALCLTTLSLNAYEMKPVGFKAMGMGGTGVASTRGSLSGYYNPALLRFSDYTAEFSVNLGLRLRDSNVIDNVDTLNKIDFETTLDNIAANATADNSKSNTEKDKSNMIIAQNTLEHIGTDNAFMISATPSLTAQMSDALAVGVYANLDVGLRLNIDANHLELIVYDTNNAKYYKYDPASDFYTETTSSKYQANSIEYAVDNELTYIQVNTMALVETPISYAEAFDKANGTYSLGISLKPMNLVTSSQKVALGKSSSQADSEEATYETTYKPTIGLDLGFAYAPRDSGVTFGLVGKNVNSPKFKVDKSNTGITEAYKIDPFFRAGMSMSVLDDNAEFAFDVDLQKSDTLVVGAETQNIGAGLEFHPSSWFSFRVGAMQDIASEKFDDGTILTTGVGFGLKWAQIDLSAMASTKSGEYDGQTIPRYTALNLSLVSRWGDGYNKKIPEGQEEAHDYENDDGLTFEEKRRLQKDAQKAQDELDKEIK